jgi:hypothetical protein
MKHSKIIVVALLMATGCSKNTRTDEHGFRYAFSQTAIVNSNLPRPEAAEKLAEGAEQLMNAKGFDQALGVATEALKLDPTNLRAGLVHAMLANLRLQKGLLMRVKPLADRSPLLKKQWQKGYDDYKSHPDFRFNSYYLDGKPEFLTELALQRHIDLMIAELEKFRLFLTAHRDAEITMIASPLFVPDMNERYTYRCKINETAGRSFELTCPPAAARRQVSLNRADFEMILGGIVYYELHAVFGNSYDLSGSVESVKDIAEVRPQDHQIIADRVMARPEFGKQRLPNTLGKARSWGLDFINGLTWASANPQLTCPKGEFDQGNRPGFFMNMGFCMVGEIKEIADISVRAFKTNGPIKVDYVRSGQTFRFSQNYMAPFEKPMESLKQLGPVKFNECGRIVDVGDRTLGGIFPDGDAPRAFALDSACPQP